MNQILVSPDHGGAALTPPAAASSVELTATADAVTTSPSQVSVSSSADDPRSAWGLRATRVLESQLTGAGIRVAVLDTGLDLNHPDYQDGRVVGNASFVAGNSTGQDGHGHGTHCVGIACGTARPSGGKRYGVATQAQILVGKVLPDSGSGGDTAILAGIEWAIGQGARVISLSLGDSSSPGRYDPVYEQVAKRAINAGTAIIAAAGNDSKRQFGVIKAVSSPASTPSMMGVAAIDENLQIASFSNGGLFGNGGAIDCAAPGVRVYSSLPVTPGFTLQREAQHAGGPVPDPTYGNLSGTSMATPYVAGIAALIAQDRSDWPGWGILNEILTHVLALEIPSRDVGKGLVIAPQAS